MLRLIAVLFLLAACSVGGPTVTEPPPSTVTPSTTPNASASPASDVGALIALLAGARLDAREEAEFDASPLGNRGILVCVGDEPVRVYVYPTADEAAARARTINPRDPSNVGTAIIEWAGQPKFWLHDRLIVLYLGTEQPVIDALLATLGDPFAVGLGRPPLPGPEEC
jgi:hypothetical protein